MSMFSATLAPLNSMVSKPAWPSMMSSSSPGFQTNVSSPAPISARSLPSPPLIRSSPSLPRKMSSPRPPFIVSWMPSASRLVALMTSSPPSPLSVNRSFAASWKTMFTVAWRPVTETSSGVARDGDDVIAIRAGHGDGIRCAVAAARRSARGRCRPASRRYR